MYGDERNETKNMKFNGGNTMKKFFAKRLKNEKGLTLIELLAVIVILAIIAAIAVPAIGSIISNSKDSAKLAAASNILAGAKIAATDNACTETAGAIKCTQDDLKPFVENVKIPENESEAKYSAERTADGAWTVTYNGLKDFNSKKYKDNVDLESTSTAITEANLNAAMDND